MQIFRQVTNASHTHIELFNKHTSEHIVATVETSKCKKYLLIGYRALCLYLTASHLHSLNERKQFFVVNGCYKINHDWGANVIQFDKCGKLLA